MDRLVARFGGDARRRKTLAAARLEVVRFRKLLENARAFLDLIQDGRDKVAGEYVLDRHYVVSLAEQAVERTWMMVFDALVLAPDGGDVLCRRFDTLKAFANTEFVRNGGLTLPPDRPAGVDVEYRQLQAVLEWMEGRGPDGGLTAMDLFRRALAHAVTGLARSSDGGIAAHTLDVAAAGGCLRMAVATTTGKLAGPTGGRISIRDLNCRPLGMMLLGATHDNGPDTVPAHAAADWVALVDDERLSLRNIDRGIVLESTVSGHADADFVFVHVRRPFDMKSMLPPMFHLDDLASGTAAWCYDVPGTGIEDALAVVGGRLFGTAR